MLTASRVWPAKIPLLLFVALKPFVMDWPRLKADFRESDKDTVFTYSEGESIAVRKLERDQVSRVAKTQNGDILTICPISSAKESPGMELTDR